MLLLERQFSKLRVCFLVPMANYLFDANIDKIKNKNPMHLYVIRFCF